MSETTNSNQKPVADTEAASLTDSIARLLTHLKEDKNHIDYIKPELLPDIDLYMDQVTTFMDTHLESAKRYDDDKILTKTMINNYAKNNLLPPPEKKKYSKDHLLLLTFIYYFKNMLSMNDIQCLLAPIKDYYFQNTLDGISLETVYREVFAAEESIRNDIVDDMLDMYKLSRESFGSGDAPGASPAGAPKSQEADAKDRKAMLQDFTFVCMLCYDIFLKKQVVERIIDKMYTEYHKESDPDRKKRK